LTGHALVGVRLTADDDTSILYIETTKVGSSSFRDAVEAAQAKVQERIDQEDPLLMSIDVVAARRLGITPVNL
jgi:hypothetical protein